MPARTWLNVQGNLPSISEERKESHECKDIDYLGREVSCAALD